jgi:hypothetical protein
LVDAKQAFAEASLPCGKAAFSEKGFEGKVT